MQKCLKMRSPHSRISTKHVLLFLRTASNNSIKPRPTRGFFHFCALILCLSDRRSSVKEFVIIGLVGDASPCNSL
ncbi:hypothetical protein BX592_1393 [Paraburkholderia rhizosphaerae]|uniref:Uncharacterized protein n=1 Tax=Paraburkholderia rhizosphaerae TaxID=480658 RepID=A0A4R8L3Z7_9BURK|nr:hypothetical protein BX592_1393 [Paraburkholderia rhizosphaerae]